MKVSGAANTQTTKEHQAGTHIACMHFCHHLLDSRLKTLFLFFIMIFNDTNLENIYTIRLGFKNIAHLD